MKAWPAVALSHDPQGLPGYNAAIESPLSGFDDPRLQRASGEGDLAFAERMTLQVFRSTYHCDYTFTGHTWATAVVAAINPTFLADQGVLTPSGFRCGFCHQRAWILAETLTRGGLEASSLGLELHVVTTFDHHGRTYVADPDAGVTPFEVNWDDRSRLEATVRDRYTMPRAELYIRIFLAADEFTHFSMPYLRAVASGQDLILRAGAALEWTLLVVGLGLLVAARTRARRSRSTSV
jgi:hypothetical protein